MKTHADSLRERTAKILAECLDEPWDRLEPRYTRFLTKKARSILAAICEEIGEVEKVYPEWVSESVRCIYDDGFEGFQKKILALLQETSTSSRKERVR